jgi:hypothetical protein
MSIYLVPLNFSEIFISLYQVSIRSDLKWLFPRTRMETNSFPHGILGSILFIAKFDFSIGVTLSPYQLKLWADVSILYVL